jgi:DnaJ-class molecular chaperone
MVRYMKPKIKEHVCPDCQGSGFTAVKQPARPGRRTYPARCKSCDGKGKIADAE